jgi:hypothetical protein
VLTDLRVGCLAALLLTAGALAGAQVFTAPIRPTPRLMALGGPHPALVDDFTSALYNPAGLRTAEPHFSIAELSAHTAGPIFDVATAVLGADTTDPAAILASPGFLTLLNGLGAEATLLGPISFGYVGSGVGFGFLSSTHIDLESVGAIPQITAIITEEIEFRAGYAFRFLLGESSALTVGALLKAVAVGAIALERSVLDLASNFDLNAESLLTEPFQLNTGVGLDAGLLVELSETWRIGLVAADLYSPVRSTLYATTQDLLDSAAPAQTVNNLRPIQLDAGIAWAPTLSTERGSTEKLTVLLSYRDALDFLFNPAGARNPILHVAAGVELTMLEILAWRVGFADGLFAAGVGLDLTLFHLDLSMYGSERSLQPGLRPTYNIALGLRFGF